MDSSIGKPLESIIEHRYADKLLFTHYTYSWKLTSILKHGLRASISGNMALNGSKGAGLYCVLADDEKSKDDTLEHVKMYFDWEEFKLILAEKNGEMPSQEFLDAIDPGDYIIPIVFEYTGEYLYCTEDSDELTALAGYVLLPVGDDQVVNATNLTVVVAPNQIRNK